jgi:hypothetical protein
MIRQPLETSHWIDKGCKAADDFLGHGSDCLHCPFPQCNEDIPKDRNCANRERGRTMMAQVDELRKQGKDRAEISEALHLHRTQVNKYLRRITLSESANGCLG